MKKQKLIIFTYFVVILFFSINAFADTIKPKQLITYINLDLLIEKEYDYQTIKAKKDYMLKIQSSNPHVIMYEEPIDGFVNKETKLLNSHHVINKNTYFRLFGECENYYRVLYENKLYYINKNDVSFTLETQTTNEPVIEEIVEEVVIEQTAIEEPIVQVDENNLEVYEDLLPEEVMLNPYNNYVKKDGNVSDEHLALANAYWNKMPLNVRKHFIENGWNIYVTDMNLAKTYYDGIYNSIAGLTIFSQKVIYVEDRNKAISSSIVHEMGHYIDGAVGYVSYGDEFYQIYNAEKNAFVELDCVDPGYSTSSTVEYFAEVFNQAMLYTDSCKTHSPLSFDFVMNAANSL